MVATESSILSLHDLCPTFYFLPCTNGAYNLESVLGQWKQRFFPPKRCPTLLMMKPNISYTPVLEETIVDHQAKCPQSSMPTFALGPPSNYYLILTLKLFLNAIGFGYKIKGFAPVLGNVFYIIDGYFLIFFLN